MSSPLPVLALALAMTLAACSGAARTSEATPVTAVAVPALTRPDRPWAELDHEARLMHMRRHVVPVMADLFVSHDPDRYASFGCPTCHGPDAASHGYAMPNPSLPVLYPTGTVGQMQTVDRYPEGVRFMFNRVTPAMRELLGAPDYDETTRTGFTCFACHPSAAPDDPLNRAPAP
ncbi:MAG: hypothetical protein OHK0013_37750 [Sandaracinaceae bacterium]